MAGSASTITYQYETTASFPIKRIKIEWTSDDTTGAVTATTKQIAGTLLYAITDPGAAAPTANYDIAITDEFGLDILAGLGGTGGTDASLANRHTSTTEKKMLWAEDSVTNPLPGSRPIVNSTLAVAVTAAGNSKNGTIYIYWSPDSRG